jgi:hypothetical protein
MNCSRWLSDQEREALIMPRPDHVHDWSRWYTDQCPIIKGHVVRYAFPGRETRQCSCGAVEHHTRKDNNGTHPLSQ